MAIVLMAFSIPEFPCADELTSLACRCAVSWPAMTDTYQVSSDFGTCKAFGTLHLLKVEAPATTGTWLQLL